MFKQKILIGTVIATAFVFILDYLWYGMLMADFFGSSPGERATPVWHWLILGILLFGYAFCRIYEKGYEENKTEVAQGINYGLLVALLVFASMAFIQYGVTDRAPLNHYLIDLVYRIVQMVILGIIIAKYMGRISGEGRPGGGMGGDG